MPEDQDGVLHFAEVGDVVGVGGETVVISCVDQAYPLRAE
jgi:hypothetical protein